MATSVSASSHYGALNTQHDGRFSCDVTPTDGTFVRSLSIVLDQLVSLSTSSKSQITRFHAIRPPCITIPEYLERIQRFFGCSHECFVLALIYIDRIVKVHERFTVSILNIHRLLITSVMLAAKFFDDVYYSNAFYARVGGVRTREINILEAHFLALINYQLFVSAHEYDLYRRNVLSAVSGDMTRVQSPSIRVSPLGNSRNNPLSSALVGDSRDDGGDGRLPTSTSAVAVAAHVAKSGAEQQQQQVDAVDNGTMAHVATSDTSTCTARSPDSKVSTATSSPVDSRRLHCTECCGDKYFKPGIADMSRKLTDLDDEEIVSGSLESQNNQQQLLDISITPGRCEVRRSDSSGITQ